MTIVSLSLYIYIYTYIHTYIHIYIYILAWTRAVNARSTVGRDNAPASKLARKHLSAASSQLEIACCVLVGLWFTFGVFWPARSLSLSLSLSLLFFLSVSVSPSLGLSPSPCLCSIFSLSVCLSVSPCLSACPFFGG